MQLAKQVQDHDSFCEHEQRRANRKKKTFELELGDQPEGKGRNQAQHVDGGTDTQNCCKRDEHTVAQLRDSVPERRLRSLGRGFAFSYGVSCLPNETQDKTANCADRQRIVFIPPPEKPNSRQGSRQEP